MSNVKRAKGANLLAIILPRKCQAKKRNSTNGARNNVGVKVAKCQTGQKGEIPCNNIGTKGPSYKRVKALKKRGETVRDAEAITEMGVQDTHKS